MHRQLLTISCSLYHVASMKSNLIHPVSAISMTLRRKNQVGDYHTVIGVPRSACNAAVILEVTARPDAVDSIMPPMSAGAIASSNQEPPRAAQSPRESIPRAEIPSKPNTNRTETHKEPRERTKAQLKTAARRNGRSELFPGSSLPVEKPPHFSEQLAALVWLRD